MTPARFITVLSVATGIFLAGYLSSRHREFSTSAASGEQAVTYTCPMHPQYRSGRAADCPICGMRLERLAPNRSAVIRKQQLIGVRTDEVRLHSSSHVLKAPGRITVDDQRIFRIVAAADGWIVDLGQNTVGSFVRKNQFLASYYQKDLLYTERLFLLSIPSNDSLPQASDFTQASIRTSGSANPMFPIDSLRGLGMSDRQIEEIHRTRAASPHINIYAPVSGFVLARNISPSQRFDKSTELYRIADISRVWAMVDIFEKDRQFLKPGAQATIVYRHRRLEARMADVLPQYDARSRTLKARFELDNPDYLLQPDMFVDVELHVEMPPALVVPHDSVIDQGYRKTVYVATAEGVFEPRAVETGWRLGDRVQITQGLESGERIVVSGNFLIDSETRMKIAPTSPAPAAPAHTASEKDPMCGMDVDRADASGYSEYNGKTYYFCSPGCKKKFDADPQKHVTQSPAEGHGTKKV